MAASSSGPSGELDAGPSPRPTLSPSNSYSRTPVTPRTPRTPRPILRNATLIIPQTGLKTHRRVTLHEIDTPDLEDDSPPVVRESTSNESSPLLRRRTNSATARRKLGTRSVWQRAKIHATQKAAQIKTFARSDVGKRVFKCSLAYLLGSMATFLPFLRNSLGVGLGGKHMVATVTVYFHPARSLGSMFDAYICAFAAFAYAAFICITSMSVSVVFTDFLDLMPIGNAIVLIVFCGGGLGFIGWVKQRMGNPLVNVACSLACLAIITVLTKEGAVQAGNYSFVKIAQVLKMVVMGVTATMFVSLTVFPVSARSNLRQSISTVTESLADMLALITNSFLTGFEEELQQKPFKKVTERHTKNYAMLTENMKDSKYEHYVFGTERQHEIEARLVLCVQQVAQSLGGLRSAADMQFSVSKQTLPTAGNGHLKVATQSMVSTPTSLLSPPIRSASDLIGTLSAIDELSDEDGEADTPEDLTRPQFSSESRGFRSPPEIFSLFIQHLGPSMKSLAFTLKEILDEEPFSQGKEHDVIVNPRLSSSLERAIQLYTRARQKALQAVYSTKDLNLNRPMDVEADWEEVAASCGHFSYSLLEVASQVRKYLGTLDELQLEVEERPAGRTWSWLKFWRPWIKKSADPEGLAQPLLSDSQPSPIVQVHTRPKQKHHLSSPPRIHHPPPSHLSRKQRFFYRLWRAFAILRRDSTKFAIKVGVGAALYALPSFIPATRPFYTQWRGEWGLLSYMLVCSMTIGTSNTTGYSRFLGTCLGAICAIVAWHLSLGQAVPLAIFGWAMALWTSYIIVGLGKGPMGRFIMLTYNLSALYAYALSADHDADNDGEGGKQPHIVEIAGHRVVSVLSGCIWGLVITRLVWPISAREKLRDGLAGLWLKLALVWARDPLLVLLDGGDADNNSPEPAAPATTNPPSTSSDPPRLTRAAALSRETALQQSLHALEALQSSARSEFELRGPFREAEYAALLKSAGRVLDALHAMDLVIAKGEMKKENGSGVGRGKGVVGLVKATERERGQVCDRVGHLFSVLASSLALSYPLTTSLPSTAHARDRLLARIFAYRRAEAAENGTQDEDFGILYAFALVTGLLGSEIEEALGVVERLFGRWEEEGE